MPYKFDSALCELIFVVSSGGGQSSDPANVNLGNSSGSDLNIDCGFRIDESSILDQGLRIIEI